MKVQNLKKISIYTEYFYPSIGGMQAAAMNLAKSLDELGNSVEVITTSDGDEIEDKLLFNFNIVRCRSKTDRFLAIRKSTSIIFIGITIAPLFFATLMNKTVVLTHHSDYYPFQVKFYLRGWLKRILSKFYTSVSVSYYLANVIGHKPCVIPNSYDVEIFNFNNSQIKTKDFIFCGRLCKEKGADLLINAFIELKKKYENITLTVIGDGPSLHELEDLTNSCTAQSGIVFRGLLKPTEVSIEMKQHHCLVVPSVWEEAFGIVVLEGLASGCEVIVSDRGGLHEAGGELVWIVEPTINNLYIQMDAIYSGARKAHRNNVSKHLNKFNRLNLGREYLKLLKINNQ